MELTPNIKNKFKFNDLSIALFLAIIAAIAYWPISLHIFSLKNDALNYFLPVRFQVSEAISKGYFPLWSPYFNLGYALYGDTQSGVWNPFVWMFSITGPYTLYKLQLETLLYIYLSGLGMFTLCRYLKLSPIAAMFAAVSYMLCGFISDSAQFLNWISGAAFLPFLVYAYLKLLSSNTIRDALFTGLFLWLMLVCAYPAEFIISIYLLLFIFIWHNTSDGLNQTLTRLKKIMPIHFLAAFVFVLLSLPAIVSYMQYFPLSLRGSGASLEDALSNPLHPSLLLSYITPLFVWNNPSVEITDGLERNCYFGLVTFIFFVSSLFSKTENRWIRFCKWGFVISLLFSLGEFSGLRTITYYVLPLMNSFRHPAMAKIFSIFFAVQLAAFSFQSLFENNKKNVLTYCYRGIWTLLLICFFYSLMRDSKLFSALASVTNQSGNYNKTIALKQLKESLSSNVLLQLNVFLQLPFLIGYYFFVLKKFQPKKVLVLLIANCIFHVMIFNFFTVVKKDKAAYIQTIIDEYTVRGYPIPDVTATIATNSKTGMDKYDEIGPINMYNKKIGRVDYRISPCNLLSQISYWDSSSIRNLVNTYPFLYQSDSAVFLNNTNTTQPFQPIRHYVFSDNKKLVDSINKYDGLNNKTIISITDFSPNQFDFHISTESKQYFVLLQNHYPNWKIKVDNKDILTPDNVNITFMGFTLEKGEHNVRFYFQSTIIITTVIISLITLLSIIVYLIINKRNPLSV